MLTGNGIGQASSALKMLDRLLYRRPGGKQYQRSTRQTNKKAALEIASSLGAAVSPPATTRPGAAGFR